jgi:6-phosphofructokinase 1
MLAAETGLVVINVPATIDNDHPLTERSLGFDTAVNTIVECVRRLNDTAAALRRIIVIETMGRDSGQLAQMAALASGAEIVVTPHAGPLTVEKMESIARRIQGSLQRGRTHAIVLVTEGVRTVPQNPGGPSKALADHLQRRFHEIIIGGEVCHVDVRHSVLGHLQRGGTPSTTDRLLAADFAEAAWEALMAARPRSGVLGLSRGRIVRHDFDASPLTRRDEELKRICRLQKDLTDYRSLPLLEEAAGRRPSARRRRRTASRPSAR